MTMLRFDHLYTGYGKTCIGSDLKGSLAQGSLTALLGTNGSGKSTLLRTLSGLQPPLTPPDRQPSTLQICGKDIRSYSLRDLAQTLSVVLTFRPEVDNLTAGDVVRMGRIPYSAPFQRPSDEDLRIIREACEMTDTTGFSERRLSTLSDGERQRIFIAKALAQDTPLIFLDEPTAFLDFPSKIAMFRLLERLAHEQHKTILLSTHDIEPALQMADSLWIMNPEGIDSGTPDELGERGVIEKFFCTDGIDYDRVHKRFSFYI